MLSGIGPADHLREFGIPVVRELPGVGQNMRDHPIIFVPFKTRPEYLLDHSAARMQAVMRWTAQGSHLRNDLQILMSSLTNTTLFEPAVAEPSENDQPPGVGMYSFINLETSAGELRLTSADPHGKPALDFRFFDDAFDLVRCREVVRTCAQLGAHPAFDNIIEERMEPSDAELESDEELDIFIRRNVVSGQHITSTCKMGPASDPMAVVDQFGRVHGLEGLRVADASIMPNCVRANTNCTTMMIGERIADFIRQGE